MSSAHSEHSGKELNSSDKSPNMPTFQKDWLAQRTGSRDFSARLTSTNCKLLSHFHLSNRISSRHDLSVLSKGELRNTCRHTLLHDIKQATPRLCCGGGDIKGWCMGVARGGAGSPFKDSDEGTADLKRRRDLGIVFDHSHKEHEKEWPHSRSETVRTVDIIGCCVNGDPA